MQTQMLPFQIALLGQFITVVVVLVVVEPVLLPDDALELEEPEVEVDELLVVEPVDPEDPEVPELPPNPPEMPADPITHSVPFQTVPLLHLWQMPEILKKSLLQTQLLLFQNAFSPHCGMHMLLSSL